MHVGSGPVSDEADTRAHRRARARGAASAQVALRRWARERADIRVTLQDFTVHGAMCFVEAMAFADDALTAKPPPDAKASVAAPKATEPPSILAPLDGTTAAVQRRRAPHSKRPRESAG